VPGLDVRQLQTSENIGQESCGLIGRPLPEITKSLQWSAGETRTQNDVGFVRQDGSQETRIFPWVVFKVGILNHDYTARRSSKACAQCRAFPKILRLANNSVYRRRNFFQNRVRPVTGTIVNDYYFHLLDWRLSNRFEDFLDCLALVEARDDN
jgi:hypothetical protein